MSYFEEMTHWSWLIIALLLFVLELAAPGVVFLWLAIAAGLTGVTVWVLPDLSWESAFLLFTVLRVMAARLGRKVWRPSHVESEDRTLSRRGAQYVGRVFQLETAIANGTGRVRVGDTTWRVEGPDLSAGAQVRVDGVNGAALVVSQVHEEPQ